MDTAPPTIRLATWPADETHLRAVRHAVFADEQAVPRDLDFDGADPHCHHALAFVGVEPVATGRIQADGHIGRVAVLKPWRNQGIGSDLAHFLMEIAGKDGHDRVYLNAQKSAVGFYRKLGFYEVGEPFMEAGIEHIRMERACT